MENYIIKLIMHSKYLELILEMRYYALLRMLCSKQHIT